MLDHIDYRSHLTQEIEHIKEMIKDFWLKEEGAGRPLLSIRFEDFLPGMTSERLMKDDLLDLQYQLKLNEDILRYRSDYVPRLSPYMGSTSIASAFGAPVVFPDKNQPISLPIIERGKDVFRLERPDLYSGDLKRVFEKVEFFLEETRGEYPITTFDFQSPFDTVHLLWNHNSFFTDLIENQEAVEYLLDIVTQLTIEAGLTLKEMIPHFVPAHCPSLWMPLDVGTTICLDSIVNIGPHMFDTYIRPSLSKISQAFGGLVIHSCGDWSHHLEKVKSLPGLKGINFGAGEMALDSVVHLFDGESDVRIIPHIGLNLPHTYKSNIEFIGHVLDTFPAPSKLFLLCWRDDLNPKTPWRENSYEQIEDFFEERGYGF